MDKPTEEKSSVTDLGYLTSFCAGDKEKIRKYINVFLKSTPTVTAQINAGLAANDFIEVANQVHGCKTKFTMMGMKDAYELAKTIEDECRAGRVNAKVMADILTILNHISSAEKELNDYLAS